MMTIRRAVITDSEAIHAVDQACFTHPWSKEALEEDIKNERFARYYVGEQDGMVIAFGGVWCVAGEGQITNIGVHPSWQGQGIGKKLVHHVLKQCWQEKIEAVYLEVRQSNEVALRLYRSLGFTSAGVRKGFYVDPVEDAYILVCHAPTMEKGI